MNILTFDIEEWYLYRKTTEDASWLPRIDGYLDRILDLLDSRSFKATFFCLGAIARDYPDVIRKIADRGHEIGCHSDGHNWLTNFSPEQLDADTRDALAAIEDAIGCKVLSYRAPAFSIGEKNKWAFEILAQNGIERDCSVFPAPRDFGGFPEFEERSPALISVRGITLKEFPIGTLRVGPLEIAYSGGGYFRLMPYVLTRQIMRRHDYVMTYFHIRDFDKEQKRTFDGRYFKNYYGIRSAYAKLSHLLGDFEFVSVAQADAKIDWGTTPHIIL